MSWLALSASFQYLWYGSTTIIMNSLIPLVRGSGIVFKRQNLTTKDDPRTKRAKVPHHRIKIFTHLSCVLLPRPTTTKGVKMIHIFLI